MHGDEIAALPSSDSPAAIEDTHLFREVLQRSDLWLQTTSLATQIRGEVRPPPPVSYDEHTLTRGVQLAIHRGPAAIEDYGIQNRSGSTALQYKLEESGAVYHIKGLGEGLI